MRMDSIAKPLISIGLLCAAFGVSYVANAQATTPTSTAEVATTSISTSPTTTEVVVPPTREERLLKAAALGNAKATLSPNRQARIINLSANLSNRMDAALWRFENITNRLESRMVKMEQEGADTADARVALANTRSSLTIASSLLKDIDDTVVNSVTASEPIKGITELRATYESIATALRQAHSRLRTTIGILRTAPSIAPEETITASTSSSTATE